MSSALRRIYIEGDLTIDGIHIFDAETGQKLSVTELTVRLVADPPEQSAIFILEERRPGQGFVYKQGVATIVRRPMKVETTPGVAPTCAECYGTGYYRGLGAPCARGCRP